MQSPSDIVDINRPPRAHCEALAVIGTATASSELSLMGIRDAQIHGPRPLKTGRSVAGPALTLQMMPKREDLYGSNEYENPERQLHPMCSIRPRPATCSCSMRAATWAAAYLGR